MKKDRKEGMILFKWMDLNGFRLILGGFWMDFGWIWGGFGMDLVWILDGFWMDFGWIFVDLGGF